MCAARSGIEMCKSGLEMGFVSIPWAFIEAERRECFRPQLEEVRAARAAATSRGATS
jgi:hypothetical protein